MTRRTRKAPPRLDLDGELTIITAAERRPELAAFVESGDQLVVGLAEVTELDTAGLQLLLAARDEAARRGVALSFAEPSPAVTQVLEIVQLDPALQPVGGPASNDADAGEGQE